MHDVTKLSDVRPGIMAKIKNISGDSIEAIIFKIISREDNPDGIVVIDKDGFMGNVVEILNSPEIIKDRIQKETQNSENKQGFYEPVMRNEVIPKTIQSFLNSFGGYLYIGVKDDAPPDEKIVGLDNDFDIIKQKHQRSDEVLSDGKIEDHFVSDIEYVLTKYLKSETSFGPLLDYDFPIVDGKKILEINIKSSAKPVFYKHLSSNNREKQFQIFYNNEKQFERILDDFYYREGSHKEPITTFEEFLRYSNEHFRKFKA